MKVKVTYAPEEENAAQAALDALRTMYPAARVHKSINNAGVSAAYMTVANPEKPHHTSKNS